MLRDMRGKYCLVTGANGGIGREIALGLAKMGATVIMICRNAERGRATMGEIRQLSGNGGVDLMLADLSSQRQIRDLAAGYATRYGKLHVLVNNAGVVMDRRVLTEDGMETTFSVNYLAYFLLTNLLLSILKGSTPARVVNLVSQAHRTGRLDFDNLQGEQSYNRDRAYAQSKLADIIFTYELARRLEGTGVTANCVCPGAVHSNLWEESSRIVSGFFRLFIKGPEEGARLPLHLACSPDLEGVTCKYYETGQHLRWQRVFVKGRVARSSRATYNDVVARKLWEISGKLTNFSGHAAA